MSMQKVSERSALYIVLLAGLLLASACGSGEETYSPPSTEGNWILVDNYHTRIQNPIDYQLKRGDFNYQGVYGWRRVFNHLNDNGYYWHALRKDPLSARRLEGYDVLFINLLHAERPDFTDEEVELIIDFVDKGGGLFVVADHSNVYRHAERVNRFLVPMGIEVLFHTVIERDGDHQVEGSAWIAVDDLSDHPINNDVEMISLQTGGPFKSEGGTAFTSEEAFGDLWNEEKSGGYGNWTYDGDPELEPTGRLAVMAAVEYGEGRVVVCGDQNMFGDAWTHFGDNFEQVMNVFEWTGKTLAENPEPLARLKPRGLNIGLDISHNDRIIGRASRAGYFGFFSNINRDPELTGRASLRIHERDDVLWLIESRATYSEMEMEQVRNFLADGKRVLVSIDPTNVGEGAAQLIGELAPEFVLDLGDDKVIDFGDDRQSVLQKLENSNIERLEKGLAARSGSVDLDVSGLQVAVYEEMGNEDDRKYDPFLYKLRSDWGEALLYAEEDSDRWDIARRKAVDEGELIIFLQGPIFRNQSVGRRPVDEPKESNKDAHELEFRVLNYLKTPVK